MSGSRFVWEPALVRSTRERASLIWVLVAAYSALTIITLLVWDTRGVYSPTGDEPHYLVMSDSATVDRSLELTQAYLREFQEQRFYEPGLADLGVPDGEILGPPAAHVISTSQGHVSWHGWGIAALGSLALPWGGVLAVRLLMAVSGVVLILCTWKLTQRWSVAPVRRAASVAALAIAYPALLAGGQIFPDLWAGALVLLGVTWLLTPHWRTSVPITTSVGTAIGLLPWLGVKFALAALVLAAAATIKLALRRDPGVVRTRVAFLVPAASLPLLLVGYHLWAFGSPFGPPLDGALVFGRDFWMLLPGLVMDQNQGFLSYNPLLWLALPGVVLLWRTARKVAAVWATVFVSLWIPGAAHPGLYGLGSFNGRYSWALACLAIVPATFSLMWLARRARVSFWLVTGSAVGFQAYLYVVGTFVSGSIVGGPLGLDLYTRPIGTWLETYSAWWFPLQGFFPAWFDPDWSFAFWPNYLWLLLAVAMIAAAGLPSGPVFTRKPLVGGLGAAFVVALVVAGLTTSLGARSETDIVTVDIRAGERPAGFVADGALRAMRLGPYTWGVLYAAEGTEIVGKWELVRGADGVVVASGEIQGSNGREAWTGSVVKYRAAVPQEYLLRVGWYGDADISIRALTVSHGDSPPPARDR